MSAFSESGPSACLTARCVGGLSVTLLSVWTSNLLIVLFRPIGGQRPITDGGGEELPEAFLRLAGAGEQRRRELALDPRRDWRRREGKIVAPSIGAACR